MYLCMPFQKKSLLIKLYVLIILVFPWRLWDLVRMVVARNLGTIKVLNVLPQSYISLYNLLSCNVHLLHNEGICTESHMGLQYTFSFWRF